MDASLPAGFALRSVSTEDEIRRYVDLNQAVTGEGRIVDRLIRRRPGSRREDFVMVVEVSTGRVVSTTCLLPWGVRYGAVSLRAAMLEMVVTDPAYRKHGLVRAQIRRFHERARELDVDFCIIQGIPYYYRQYGYAYAMDHSRAVHLAAPRVPRARPGRLGLRPCTTGDAETLASLHGRCMSAQGVWVTRTAADWVYLMDAASLRTEMVERAGEPVGYVCVTRAAENLTVTESALERVEDASAVLSLLAGRGAGMLVLGGNRAAALSRRAEDLGGEVRVPGQWLVSLPDPRRFLERIAPVLDTRLGQSRHRGVSAELVLNFFRRAVRIRIERGHVLVPEDAGFVDASLGADGGDLCIPPEAFARLVFGYRTLDQLRDAWPDTLTRASSAPLIETLFAPEDTWILMPY